MNPKCLYRCEGAVNNDLKELCFVIAESVAAAAKIFDAQFNADPKEVVLVGVAVSDIIFECE